MTFQLRSNSSCVHSTSASIAALLSSAVLLTTPAPAAADLYGSIGVGWSYAETLKVPDTSARIDFDYGMPTTSLALGLRRDRWRFELEVSHQENEPEILFFRDSDVEIDSRESDELSATSFMLNVFRDFHIGAGFRPYLGAGLGPARVELLFRDDATEEEIINDHAWAAALQGIAGVEIPVTGRLSLGLDYRYWKALDVSLTDPSGEDYSLNQGIHSGWLRAQYRFGGRNDPVAPHPAPDAGKLTFAAVFGGAWAVDEDLSNSGGAMLDAYSIGPMGAISVGYRFKPRWHAALELTRRNTDMQVIDYGFGNGEARTEGDVRTDSLTLNLTYRFRPQKAVSPYGGIGLGGHWTRYDISLAADGSQIADDTATGGMFAWWFGFDFAINPQWTATADYRMWIGDTAAFDLSDGTPVKGMHVGHGMTIGIRYALSGDR